MKKTILVCLLYCFNAQGQDIQSMLKSKQDSLVILSETILKGNSDEFRIEANRHFTEILERALSFPESFNFGFEQVQIVSKLSSPDNVCRVYSWVMESKGKNEYRYFGFIQLNEKSDNKQRVFFLADSTIKLESPEQKKLSCNTWYGSVYYKMLQNKQGGKNYYTLLGWKGKDNFSTMKVIDAFYLSRGKPVFASNIFPQATREKSGKKNLYRIIFEYNKEAVMNLKYDEQVKMIVFDHLSPPDAKMKDIFSSYGPDFSYDALQFKKGKWNYIPNFEARNPTGSKGNPRKSTKDKPIYKVK